MNGVSGRNTVQCVSVCASVCSGLVNSTSEVVKATDFKFDVHVSGHDPLKFFKKGRGQGHVIPKFLGVKC